MRRDSSIRKESLNKLLENPRVWRGQNQSHTAAGLSTGYRKLDQHLPGGGWPQQSLTEILVEQYGIGELQLLMPALASLSVDDPLVPYAEPGWIAWVAPPFQPYPPALQQRGINLSRLLIVRPKNDSEILWSAELLVFWLLPENEEFEPIQVDLSKQEMVIEGVVVGVIRDSVPLN